MDSPELNLSGEPANVELPDDQPVVAIEVEVQDPPISSEIEEGEHEDIIARLMDRYRVYKEWRDAEAQPIWDAVYRAYRGFKPTEKWSYVIREIFRQMETLKPQVARQFFGNDTLFRFVPRAAGDEERAEAATSIANQQLKRYRSDKQCRAALDNALLYGTAYIHPQWRRFKHTKLAIKSIHAPDDGDGAKAWWKRETTEQHQDAPFLEFCSCFEIYTHPFIEDCRESPVAFRRQIVSSDNLKTLIREGWLDADIVKQAVEEGGSDGNLQEYNARPADAPTYNARLNLSPRGDSPHEMITAWTSDGWEYVILDQKWLCRGTRGDWPEIPLIPLRNYPQAGEHYGIPEPLIILDDQRLLNDFMSMYVDATHYSLAPMFKVKQSAWSMWQMTNFKPGGAVRVINMDDVQPLLTSQPQRALAEESMFIRQNMKLSTGITDELAGVGSQAKTATQHVRLQDAAGVRIEDKTRFFIDAFEDAYRAIYRLNALNLNEEIAVRMEGDMGKMAFKTYSPDIFQVDVDVEVQLANNMDVGPEAAMRWQSYYQLTASDPLIERKRVHEAWLRSMGQKKPRHFLVNPNEASVDAMDENREWSSFGVVLDPKLSDNDAVHLSIHQMFMQTPEYQQRPPEWQNFFIRHMSFHQARIQSQQQQPMAAPQEPNGSMMPEADQRTEAMFMNGQRGAAQQGSVMGGAA